MEEREAGEGSCLNDINFVNVGLAGGQGVGFTFFFFRSGLFFIFFIGK